MPNHPNVTRVTISKWIPIVAVASILIAASPRSCQDQAYKADAEVICAAITHSPHYSGGKLDAAGMQLLHKWIRKTNFTLDDLGCLNGSK